MIAYRLLASYGGAGNAISVCVPRRYAALVILSTACDIALLTKTLAEKLCIMMKLISEQSPGPCGRLRLSAHNRHEPAIMRHQSAISDQRATIIDSAFERRDFYQECHRIGVKL